MDSPELQYLKAMHKVNQKFYTHATLALADLKALLTTAVNLGPNPNVQAAQEMMDQFQKQFQLEAIEQLNKREV
ncbi:MAG TPA: hypothetical protein VE863_01275 [Pyrinomonadaceae bacterium]|jgi:hypothetical protein|nr:hypothetical protein [Pyrinomonadaceae bacterium]